MSVSTLKGKNVPVRMWTKVEEVESQALDQLKNIAALPWVFKHVAVMPDYQRDLAEVVAQLKHVMCVKG